MWMQHNLSKIKKVQSKSQKNSFTFLHLIALEVLIFKQVLHYLKTKKKQNKTKYFDSIASWYSIYREKE